jgi:hypothetical protein
MLRLTVIEPAHADRLEAFLRSVGQEPTAAAPGVLQVVTPPEELEVYLRVWQVIHPGAAVRIE